MCALPIVVTLVLVTGCRGSSSSTAEPPSASTVLPATTLVPSPLVGTVSWKQVSGRGPTPRWGHVAAYDRAHHRMIVFGGTNGGGGGKDLWSFDLASERWEQLEVPDGPSGRYTPAAIADDQRHRMILVGGGDGTQTFGDVWALDFDTLTWAELPAGPPPRFDGAATTDGTTAWFFGGFGADNRSLNDLWQLDLATGSWTELPATARPTPRTNTSLAKIGDGLLLTGGHAEADALNPDTWRYDLDARRWMQLPEANTPQARAHYAYATDATCGLLLLFGGDQADTVDSGELLAVSPGPPARFASVGEPTPPARRHSAIVVDPDSRRIVMMGGRQGADRTLDDSWVGRLPDCRR